MPNKKKQFDIDAGDRLRHAREALGHAQNDFAAAIGVPPQRLNNWEKGRNGAPPAELAPAWLTYGISLDYIYLGLLKHCNEDTQDKIRALRVVANAGTHKRKRAGSQ